MDLDGADRSSGPRNVSHRVAPTLLADGRVLDHRVAPPRREQRGRPHDHAAGPDRRARGVRPRGQGRHQQLPARQRSRAGQAGRHRHRARPHLSRPGKLVRIDLGGGRRSISSREARSQRQDLTPDVPLGREPSFKGVGRYYDVDAVGRSGKTGQFLVSAGPTARSRRRCSAWPRRRPTSASTSTTRRPDALPGGQRGRQLGGDVADRGRAARRAAAARRRVPGAGHAGDAARGASTSTTRPCSRASRPGTVKKVRVTEGFSSEEGFPNSFGLTEFDGQARLGEVDVDADGSFKALDPGQHAGAPAAHRQVRLAVDAAGRQRDEPVWIQGRAGEARVCGGCHEDRTKAHAARPGLARRCRRRGAAALDYAGKSARSASRRTSRPTRSWACRGTRRCSRSSMPSASTATTARAGAANPSYTITDMTDMTTFSFTFDLTQSRLGQHRRDDVHATPPRTCRCSARRCCSARSRSWSPATPKSTSRRARRATRSSSRCSTRRARYPAIDVDDRAFGTTSRAIRRASRTTARTATEVPAHATTSTTCSSLMADKGGQFFSRENARGRQLTMRTLLRRPCSASLMMLSGGVALGRPRGLDTPALQERGASGSEDAIVAEMERAE